MIEYKEVKSILNKHKKRDSWFLDEYSINPYEGCGFNCSYCYIHGSRYGENLAEKIVIKKNATAILDKQLGNRAKKNQYGIIAVGSATDAYMQAEEKTGLTNKLLRVILKHRFPVFISTKSALIIRDFDLLKEIDTSALLPQDLKQTLNRGVIISFSFSTLDARLARPLEPGAPLPQERLEAMKQCAAAGFLCGMNAMPLLPFVSDTDEELEKMVAAAKENGAQYILTSGMTLPGDDARDSRQLYFRFLQNHYPHLMEKYKAMYGSVFYPSWQYQNDLKRRTTLLCKKYQIRNSII
jgi:DNA repair photolyase